MNLVDLPDLMREHTEHDPVPVLAASRMESIRHRVVVARRRRVARTIAAFVIVALAGFGISVPLQHSDRHKAPVATTTKKINGYPEYASGGHLVGTAKGSLVGPPLSLTFTPTQLGFVYASTCTSVPKDVEITIDLTVNGHDSGGFSCSDTVGGTYFDGDDWVADGVRIGQPTTFTFMPETTAVMTESDGSDKETGIPLPDGQFSVAVLQKIPFDQYPLPPRPANLSKLDMGQVDFGSGAKPSVIDSSPQSPLQPETFTFTFPDCAKTLDNGCLRAALMSSTPGYLAVTVNNVSIGTAEFWDYSVAGWQFDLAPDMGKLQLHKGERVTVTITPQYVSGPWQLGIATKPTK